jgi:alanine-synthesizing transaminase
MSLPNEEFYRIAKLPTYVFAVTNEMKAKLRAAQQDVVDFGMGNPDGATPRAIVNKLVEAARNPRNHRYSMSKGIPQMRLAITERYKRKWGVDLDPNTEAIATIGAKEGLSHLLFAILGPGDMVALPNPCYPIHQYGVIMAEGQTCLLPMDTPDEFLNQLEHLYATLDYFRPILDLAAKHGTMVIHDFAYADLGFDGYQPPSILQISGAKEHAVEIFSMTKSYNMAGWRVGFVVGNKKMVNALGRIKSYLDYGNFQAIQIASIIALRECEEDTVKICNIYQKRRDLLVRGLNRAGWPVESPRGSMFLWAKIPERFAAGGSLEFAKQLLEKALVAVAPGIGFGPMGEGYVRFAFIENNHRTRQAIQGIKQFLNQ